MSLWVLTKEELQLATDDQRTTDAFFSMSYVNNKNMTRPKRL